MICEYCGKEHDGSFGSGRFCSDSCRRAFCGSKRQKSYIRRDSKIGGWYCTICSSNFRTRRLLQEHRKVHANGKTQVHTKINFKCCFCEKEFFNKNLEYKTQHQNHCKMNPNAVLYKGHLHTEEEKKHLSECAKRNNFGGWHTSKSIDYNGIKLDSSYELAFVQDLDKNNIKWERPKPLMWEKDGNTHRYYPDFFLPEYGIFVDTKNDYLINCINPRFGITDVEKIHLVEQQNNVKIYILDKNNLLWSSLAGLSERLNGPDL